MSQGRTRGPLVSVLLPVRDGAAFLPEAIASLRAQTLAQLEVIAVDDGSTDETPDVLEDWGRSDRRVRILHQEASGIVAALERARREARAPLLARMDADDLAHPERFERQVAFMEAHPGVGLCGTLVEYFPRGVVRDGARRYERWINSLRTPEELTRDLFVECPLPHPSFCMRARAIEEVGGYRQSPPFPEDYDLVLRLWRGGWRLAKIPEPLLRWREHPRRLSRRDPRYSPNAFRRCKVHHLLRSHLAGDRRVVVWGAGPVGKGFGRELQRAGVGLEAYVDLDPRKIGQAIHGAPVVGPDAIGSLRGAFCLAAVGQEGAREEIRSTLLAAGWREREEFVAVA